MTNSLKLAFSTIMITLIVLGLSSHVAAQPSSPTIYVDAPSTVTVSTEFDIIIWVRDIPGGWGMVGNSFELDWDPNDLEYIGCEFLGEGRLGTWIGDCDGTGGDGGAGAGGSAWTTDAEWFRFRFHCLREGPAPIIVSSLAGFALEPLAGGIPVLVPIEPVTVTIQQVELAPVGGISTPINKLEMLTPYIALAGLIAVVSAVYIIKRRKD